MSRAYYNEIDPHAAQWLRNLIDAGHIAPGDVDERSIEDVRPTDLVGYTQCHFFAGIGIWSYALRQAGWPDDRPVWTGSCPCQPFSTAGKGDGFADERHLWPAWHWLIEHGKPDHVPVFGEQVANGDGLTWLDLVQADMEASGYAFGAFDLCAAGFGAPHIRQRLFFHAKRVAITNGQPVRGEPGWGNEQAGSVEEEARQRERSGADAGGGQSTLRLADPGHGERGGRDTIRRADGEHDGAAGTDEGGGEGGAVQAGQRAGDDASVRGAGCGVADATGMRERADELGRNSREAEQLAWPEQGRNGSDDGAACRPGPTNGRWAAADWLWCRDGKWRAVEPGTFPLAHGAAGRMVRLRAYGNGIVTEVATEFIKACMMP